MIQLVQGMQDKQSQNASYASALNSFDLAKPLAKQINQIENMWDCAIGRGVALAGLHRDSEAEEALNEAIGLFEKEKARYSRDDTKTFSLDLRKHDRNLYVSQSGDRLTNLPTWDQRVEFNNIVNAVLNKFRVSANVKSGFYTIRKGFECMTEYDWQDQKPRWIYHNEINGNYIESVDEKQYLEDRRLKRLELARQKRSEAKLQNQEDGALSF